MNLIPKIAAIIPIYKQSNKSIELIKKINFNQNLIINPNEQNELISDSKWTSYPTNDEDEYEQDNIRLDNQNNKEPLIVLVPKLYCLEASLSFEQGKPLFKWIIKDCKQETSSSVCELSEQLLIEEDNKENQSEINKSIKESTIEMKYDLKNRKENDEDESRFVDESVNKLVNQFLNESTNKTTKNIRPFINRDSVTESNLDIKTESSEDEQFKSILSDLLKEEEFLKSTIPNLINKNSLNDKSTTTANTINDLTSTTTVNDLISTTNANDLTSVKTTKSIDSTTKTITNLPITPLTTILFETTFNYPINETSIIKLTNDSNLINNTNNLTTEISIIKLNTNLETNSNNTNDNCKTEQYPLVQQFLFAANIAFNSFTSLIINLINRNEFNENQFKNSKLIFLSALILFLILLLTIILLILILIFRFLIRKYRTKRRLLLDELSEQKYNAAFEKKFDDCYYNIPHQNRNIYVSDYRQTNLTNQNLLINPDDKYKSIPKEYFY